MTVETNRVWQKWCHASSKPETSEVLAGSAFTSSGALSCLTGSADKSRWRSQRREREPGLHGKRNAQSPRFKLLQPSRCPWYPTFWKLASSFVSLLSHPRAWFFSLETLVPSQSQALTQRQLSSTSPTRGSCHRWVNHLDVSAWSKAKRTTAPGKITLSRRATQLIPSLLTEPQADEVSANLRRIFLQI